MGSFCGGPYTVAELEKIKFLTPAARHALEYSFLVSFNVTMHLDELNRTGHIVLVVLKRLLNRLANCFQRGEVHNTKWIALEKSKDFDEH